MRHYCEKLDILAPNVTLHVASSICFSKKLWLQSLKGRMVLCLSDTRHICMNSAPAPLFSSADTSAQRCDITALQKMDDLWPGGHNICDGFPQREALLMFVLRHDEQKGTDEALLMLQRNAALFLVLTQR